MIRSLMPLLFVTLGSALQAQTPYASSRGFYAAAGSSYGAGSFAPELAAGYRTGAGVDAALLLVSVDPGRAVGPGVALGYTSPPLVAGWGVRAEAGAHLDVRGPLSAERIGFRGGRVGVHRVFDRGALLSYVMQAGLAVDHVYNDALYGLAYAAFGVTVADVLTVEPALVGDRFLLTLRYNR
jgi:hypothetical protein